MIKVAVIGGTAFDTKLGANILKDNNIDVIEVPLSNNPKEQSNMQLFAKKELTDYAISKIKPHLNKISAAFVYCNSFSAAADIERMRKELNIKIVTPLDQYKKYANKYNNILVWAANAQSSSKIENILTSNNKNINILSLGFLPLVEEIEQASTYKEIDQKLKLNDLLNVFLNITIANEKLNTLILGCTHFPYLAKDLQKIEGLKILDPAQDMIKELLE